MCAPAVSNVRRRPRADTKLITRGWVYSNGKLQNLSQVVSSWRYQMRRFVLLCLASCAVACGGSSGQIRLFLTDTPADLVNVSQVNITLDEIRVHDDAS